MNSRPESYAAAILRGLSPHLNGEARPWASHTHKLALCVVDDNSLEVSGEDGGSPGL